MNVRVISAIRRVAQQVRHWAPLRFLEPFWNLLRRPYLWLLHREGSAAGIEVSIGDHVLRLHPAFATLRWEQIERTAYRAFIGEVHPDSVVFDIGSHMGTYAMLAASRIKPPGKVVAFEPHARTREFLRQHLQWNAGGEQVIVRDVCCGAATGAADFYCVPEQMEGTNGLVPVPGFERQTVPMSTVDEEVRQLGCTPTLIKIDVEGAEWDVLKGAVGVLTRSKPVLLLSLHPEALRQQGWSDDEVLDWLCDRGYHCEVISRDHEVHVLARAS